MQGKADHRFTRCHQSSSASLPRGQSKDSNRTRHKFGSSQPYPEVSKVLDHAVSTKNAVVIWP